MHHSREHLGHHTIAVDTLVKEHYVNLVQFSRFSLEARSFLLPRPVRNPRVHESFLNSLRRVLELPRCLHGQIEILFCYTAIEFVIPLDGFVLVFARFPKQALR